MAIVCTKCDRNRTIPSWVIRNLANFCPSYVMLWPLSLIPWPLTFMVLRASYIQTLCKIWAKSNNSRQSYSRFSTFSPSNFWPGPKQPNKFQECVDQTAPNLQRIQSDHRRVMCLLQNSDILLRFQTQAAQSQVMWKTTPNLALLTPPPVKIRGGVGEISGSRIVASPTIESRVYIW